MAEFLRLYGLDVKVYKLYLKYINYIKVNKCINTFPDKIESQKCVPTLYKTARLGEMDGRRKSAEDSIMRGLKRAVNKEFRRESKNYGVSIGSYTNLWNGAYGFLREMCESMPEHNTVKDSVGLVGNYGRLMSLCRLHLREEYAEQKMELRNIIDSSGVVSTEIDVASKVGLLPLSLHSFRPLISSVWECTFACLRRAFTACIIFPVSISNIYVNTQNIL